MSSRATARQVPLVDPAFEPALTGLSPRLGGRPLERRATVALVVADVLVMLAVLPMAMWAAAVIRPTEAPGLWSRPGATLIPFAALPFLAGMSLYERRRRISNALSVELPRIVQALSLLGFMTLLLIHALDLEDRYLFDGEVFAFCIFAAVAIPISRAIVRCWVVAHAVGCQRTVIVGAGRVGQDVARKIRGSPEVNLDVVGFVDNDPQPLSEQLAPLRVLGPERDLIQIVRDTHAERVIITFSRATSEQLIEIIRWSNLHEIHLSIVPRFFEVLASTVEIDAIGPVPVLDLPPAQLSRWALAVKRTTDLLLTILALPLLLPLCAAIALAIKLDSRGPILFRQLRIGRAGCQFSIYKFRTMVPEAEALRGPLIGRNEVSGPLFKIREDPRVTRVGRFLRRTSLDELPQLLNVLRGEMSFVGPRPFIVDEASEITGWGRRRVALTPGITGPWQIMGRNDMQFDEMIKLDYLYVTRWSLGWDLMILLRTIPTVLFRRGAY